jgi:glycerol uptake facilitator-like aquaporin
MFHWCSLLVLFVCGVVQAVGFEGESHVDLTLDVLNLAFGLILVLVVRNRIYLFCDVRPARGLANCVNIYLDITYEYQYNIMMQSLQWT